MLEKECIQSVGFRNVIEDGKAIGFQIKIRSVYYRGLWLSQIRPATIKVDGTTYKGNEITWKINDKGIYSRRNEKYRRYTLGDQ